MRNFVYACAVIGCGTAASAQPSGGAADAAAQQGRVPAEQVPASDADGGIQDIVVTAQRRAENLQDVPITMSVLGASELQAAGIANVEQVARLTPGLFVGKFDTLRPQVYLRGVGSRVFDPGSEGSVGIFTDESYMGRFSGSLTDVLDVERIEVLKGPQGTLYGRNTIAGAINIITRAPTDTFEGYAEASYGNYNQYDVRGAVSGPLSDTVRFRIAARTGHRDGFSRNTASGRRGNGDDGDVIRARLAADVTERLTVDLIGEYQHASLPGLLQESTGSRQFLQAASSPSYTPTPDKYSEAYNIDGYSRRSIYSGVGKIAWRGDAVTLNSITSYRRSTIGQAYDLDATPRNIWTFDYRERSRQFSQEVRLSSSDDGAATFGGAIDWVLGGYYYNEQTRRADHFNLGADSIFATNQAATEVNTYATRISTKSYAAFGQITANLTDTLHITAGGRYTHDRKAAVITTTTTSTIPPSYYPGFTVRPGKSWSSFDPKLTIDYQLSRRILAYATASRGFKSGGFQYNSTNAALAAVVFNPERAWTYEAGLKSQFLDNKVQLNVAAFYYDYKNLQLPLFVLLPPPAPAGSGSNVISNAAKSTIKGIDATTLIAVTPEFTLSGGVSYLDAKYDRYVTGTANYSGNRMIRSPKWQANAAASYETPLNDALKLKLRGDWSYTSRIFFEADEGARPFTSQEGFSLFNARVGLAEIDDRWAVEGWVSNIADKHYVNTVFSVPVTVLQVWSLPRTYGGTVRYRF
ncbi:TonB-dependent receptor [Sphingomonas profundi]|uniref:TonB-dependent receptor n=1 Tax=Alterirhizorhabdus profundi TaxID=2681549 RepID=UPI0012E8A522|nr:TonB-dependent receptor [Sphingomonas profundi]